MIGQAREVNAYEELFVSCLPLIKRVTTAVARRQAFSSHDAEEFAAVVLLRLINDDYGVLRKYEGRAALRTFLFVVIHRMGLDFRVAQWGKWRPSAESRRMGRVGVLLERLRMRDGLSFDEACRVLEESHGLVVDREALARLNARFHQRPRLVNDDEIEELPSPAEPPDASLLDAGHRGVISEAARELADVLAQHSVQDRLILKLHFADGLSRKEIASVLHVDPKRIYYRLPRLLLAMRAELKARGIEGPDVLAALGSEHESIDVFASRPGPCAAVRRWPARLGDRTASCHGVPTAFDRDP